MGTTTAVRQLLKSLCQNTQWKYAVLWKFRDPSQILLTWEDGYFDGENSGGFQSGKPGIISFGKDMDAQSGNYMACPIEMAVASMSCCSYQLGDGIIGKVASKRKHHWIFASKINSKLQPELPQEWQAQFEAGIKTILLVPVIPLGVVQLGSFDTVLEDLKEIVHIKDIFGTTQHITETCISLKPRMKKQDPYIPYSWSSTDKFSTSSTDNLPNLVYSPNPRKKNSAYDDFGFMTKNEISTSFINQADFPLSQNVNDHTLEDDISPCTGVWNAMFSDLLVDGIGEPSMQSLSEYTNKIIEDDLLNFSTLGHESNLFSSLDHIFTSKQFGMSNSYMKDLEPKGYDEEFVSVFPGETESIVDCQSLDFPFDCELHKALGLGSLEKQEDCVWNDILSNADELSGPAAFSQTQLFEVFGTGESGNAWFTKERTESLLNAVIADLRNASDDESSGASRYIRSCSESSGKFPYSCLSQGEFEGDALGLEESMSRSHERSILASENEDFISSLTGSSIKSTISMSSVHGGQRDKAYEPNERRAQSSLSGNKRRKTNSSSISKPKPRDRQLIQDRIKELRELIPNGSKCSIDALLDHTIKHMLFLQGIPGQAEKLKHSAHPKLKGEPWNSPRLEACQNGASWVYELGHQTLPCPLIVENLDQPEQMLIEMQCEEYGFFLEIAQIIKRLKLTILKGILESQSDKLWAHFIIETPRGFHRMEILWPLMQLLQRSTPIPSKR